MLRILALIIFLIFGFTENGGNPSIPSKQYRYNSQSSPVAPDFTGSNPASNAQENRSSNRSVEGHSRFDPNWALVIVGLLTLLVIWRQTVATRISADAAFRSIELIKTKDRAKLLINIDSGRPQNLQFAQSVPSVSLTVSNVGESKARILLAVGGLHFSKSRIIEESGSGYFHLTIDSTIMDSNEHVREDIRWPQANWRSLVIEHDFPEQMHHIHGIIMFRDAFEDTWEHKFHYIWEDCGAIVFMHPYGNIYGRWISQIDEKEKLILPQRTNRTLQFARQAWKKWKEISEQDYP